MRLALPNRPNFEVWRASECDLSTLLQFHVAGLKGILGSGDSEFFVWPRDVVDHGTVAKYLGIGIQCSVDFHRELENEFALLRPNGSRRLQYAPWCINWESIGYPAINTSLVDYPIHEWLTRRGFSYIVTHSMSQVWRRGVT